MNKEQEEIIKKVRKDLSEKFNLSEEKVADLINNNIQEFVGEQATIQETIFLLTTTLTKIKAKNVVAFNASFKAILLSLITTYIKDDKIEDYLELIKEEAHTYNKWRKK